MSRSLAAGERVTQVRRTRRIIFGLIALTVLLRAPGLGRPLLGDFATKNVVYAMIARNWALERASFFTPTLDCLAGGERTWHLLELPLPAYWAGFCWYLCGGSLDAWGRGISIVASVASVWLLFLLARRWHGERVACTAAVIFALAPVSIVYGQSFMLEASVVALTLGTIWAFDGWCAGRSRWHLLLAVTLFGLLVLTKIYMLVLLLPLAWMLWNSREAGEEGRSYWRLALTPGALLLGAVPALLWCAYAISIADPTNATSARVFYSLRDSASSHGFLHPLLGQPEFYAGALRSLATVVLTPVGLVLLLAGLRHEAWRRHAAWLASTVLLLLVLPRKFHEMNYYYLVVLPPLCVIAALGWEVVTRRFTNRRVLFAVASVGLLCSLRYAVRPAFVTPAEDAMVLAAAERVRSVTPAGSWIVTMHGSSIDLLYYADRPGVAVSPDEDNLRAKLARFRDDGAALLAVAEMDFQRLPESTRQVLDQNSLVESGPGYRLYRLSSAEPAELARRVATIPD